jgi:hypothetical protein
MLTTISHVYIGVAADNTVTAPRPSPLLSPLNSPSVIDVTPFISSSALTHVVLEQSSQMKDEGWTRKQTAIVIAGTAIVMVAIVATGLSCFLRRRRNAAVTGKFYTVTICGVEIAVCMAIYLFSNPCSLCSPPAYITETNIMLCLC